MQLADQFKTGESRQLEVREDGVEGFALRPLQAEITADFHRDPVTLCGQHRLQAGRKRRVVFDQQNVRADGHGFSGGFDARQHDAKSGATADLRLILQRAAVLFNDARGDG